MIRVRMPDSWRVSSADNQCELAYMPTNELAQFDLETDCALALFRKGEENPDWVIGVNVAVAKDILFDSSSLVLRQNPHDAGDPALIFYLKGEEIRSYALNELVKDSSFLKRRDGSFSAASHAMGEHWCTEFRRCDSVNGVEVCTCDGGRFVFSLETGEILS